MSSLQDADARETPVRNITIVIFSMLVLVADDEFRCSLAPYIPLCTRPGQSRPCNYPEGQSAGHVQRMPQAPFDDNDTPQELLS